MYVEMVDGAYIPIGMRKPEGDGPFPLILFATGNGGGGMAMLRDHIQTKGWTQDELLKAGYAVAWMRYRAEVDYAYDKIGKLIQSGRQHRQLFNRGPLEYEDAIAVAEYVKTLPYIDGDRLGYIGVSHGGEMALKIASEYHGFKALVASEPASHEFLRLQAGRDRACRSENRPAECRENADARTGQSARRASPRTSPAPALRRSIRRSLCRAATATNCRASFASATTCCTRPARTRSGKATITTCTALSIPCAAPMARYAPDAVQRQAFADTLAFFDKYLKQ